MHLSQLAQRLDSGCGAAVGQFALRVVDYSPLPLDATSGETAATATVPAGATSAVIQNPTAAPITATVAGLPPVTIGPFAWLSLTAAEIATVTFSAPVSIWYT